MSRKSRTYSYINARAKSTANNPAQTDPMMDCEGGKDYLDLNAEMVEKLFQLLYIGFLFGIDNNGK